MRLENSSDCGCLQRWFAVGFRELQTTDLDKRPLQGARTYHQGKTRAYAWGNTIPWIAQRGCPKNGTCLTNYYCIILTRVCCTLLAQVGCRLLKCVGKLTMVKLFTSEPERLVWPQGGHHRNILWPGTQTT